MTWDLKFDMWTTGDVLSREMCGRDDAGCTIKEFSLEEVYFNARDLGTPSG